MKISFASILNSHKGKTAICCGLGYCLNENLSWIESVSKQTYVTFCCNLFYKMTNIDADFWLVRNPQEAMQLTAMREHLENYKGVFIYDDINDKENKASEILCNTNYIYFGNEDLAQLVANYCNEINPPYKGVDSVIVHLVALAILCGCEEICIAGVDLDYEKGYVDGNKSHPEGVQMGRDMMKSGARDSVVRDLQALKKYASNIGVKIKVIDEGTYLAKTL